MMRAIAVLSLSGLVWLPAELLSSSVLSVAHAQAPSGKVLPAAGSPVARLEAAWYDSAACCRLSIVSPGYSVRASDLAESW